jgi:hypothetical protein
VEETDKTGRGRLPHHIITAIVITDDRPVWLKYSYTNSDKDLVIPVYSYTTNRRRLGNLPVATQKQQQQPLDAQT